MNGKRWMALLLALVMSFSLFACGAKPAENTGDNSQNTAADGTTRVFTDSCGREVTVPVTVEKIAVSGPLAQIVFSPWHRISWWVSPMRGTKELRSFWIRNTTICGFWANFMAEKVS